MTVTLVTVPDVEICGTGTYPLSSGETTFSQEDLADAVRAAQDATVPTPRLKIGHLDPRFSDLDGEPAFGTVQNMRLSDDQQKIIGDYTNVPDWLAASLPSAYPSRSIEGGQRFTAPSGREYKLVISNVALLGTTLPGITSLADLREILDRNGDVSTEPIAAASEQFVIASLGDASVQNSQDCVLVDLKAQAQLPAQTPIVAAIDLGKVHQQFIADLDAALVPTVADVADQACWWPRSVRAENGALSLIVDADGKLLSVPFTEADGTLTYGDPQVVISQYVPVAASAPGDGQRELASWPTRAASRPSTTPEVATMDVDTAVLRKRLGLAEDADDAAITEALTAEPTPDPEPDADPPATAPIPEGMRLVDAETWETTRSQAAEGAAVAASIKTQRKTTVIQAAAADGKFPVSRREHYANLWDRDPEGTERLLTASEADGGLASGLVPVKASELGTAGDGEGQPQTEALEDERFMQAHFPNEYARLHASGVSTGLRVRTEA